jgi:hypothetical protein
MTLTNLSLNLANDWELDKTVKFNWETLDISRTFDMIDGEFMNYYSLAIFIRELAYCKTPLKRVEARGAHQDQIDMHVRSYKVPLSPFSRKRKMLISITIIRIGIFLS